MTTNRALDERTRIVVTGLGAVCPLGAGVESAWRRLCQGESGLTAVDPVLMRDVPARAVGAVPSVADDPEAGFDPDGSTDARERRKMDRFIEFALAASSEALASARWTAGDGDPDRVATIIGSGIGGFGAIRRAVETVERVGVRRLSPFTVPAFLANLAAGWVSIRHGLRGPLGTPVTACAAGVQAIGDAARLLRAGEADAALCGGAESCIDRVSLGGFAAARALATRESDPSRASRPFDDARDGFVMGEGAGILFIETLEHARSRGATPIAELLGYGTSSDAHHLTGAPADGEGAVRAMRIALAQARLEPAGIDHVNAHATSTPLGDSAELNALAAVFGRGAGPAISSTKSATGHLLGAAGGLEAVFSVLALRDGRVPPTLNLDRPDPAAEGLDLVSGGSRPASLENVLSNGFGFGGVNASVVFGRIGG